jgi:hypothetical protein
MKMQEIKTHEFPMVTGAGLGYEIGHRVGEAGHWFYNNVLMSDGWLDAINPYNIP